jgi:hypothetical protein
MKLLRIADSQGQFLAATGSYVGIDRITKEDLLRLVGLAIDEEAAELDEFDSEAIKNQAHKVIYKSVALKLTDLRKRRKQFIDEAARLFLEEYESYRT